MMQELIHKGDYDLLNVYDWMCADKTCFYRHGHIYSKTYRGSVLVQKATLQLRQLGLTQSSPTDPQQRSLKQVHWVVAISLWDE